MSSNDTNTSSSSSSSLKRLLYISVSLALGVILVVLATGSSSKGDRFFLSQPATVDNERFLEELADHLLLQHDHHDHRSLQTGNVVVAAQGQFVLSNLVYLLTLAGMTNGLANGGGPYTILAPTNLAFDLFPTNLTATFSRTAQRQDLLEILRYHVIPQRIPQASFQTTSYTTIGGSKVVIQRQYGYVFCDGHARILVGDIGATNGLLHLINEVLVPPELRSKYVPKRSYASIASSSSSSSSSSSTVSTRSGTSTATNPSTATTSSGTSATTTTTTTTTATTSGAQTSTTAQTAPATAPTTTTSTTSSSSSYVRQPYNIIKPLPFSSNP